MPLADAAPGLSLFGAIPEVLLLVALAVLGAVAALSHERNGPFSASLVYLAMGAVAALVLRKLGIDPFHLITGHDTVEVLTDVTIAVAVFATGVRLRRAPARRWRTLWLLLLVTMPLTAAAIALYAKLAMGLPLAAAIVLGAALAPTDPVPIAALLALIGSGIAPRERLYVAWFGVKGVAALNYAVVAAAGTALAQPDRTTVLWTTIACVIVSIVVHGISANAVTRRLLPD